MSKTPVPFAPETLETIQRAFRMAADRRHEEVGLEHLLLSITDEPQARRAAGRSARARAEGRPGLRAQFWGGFCYSSRLRLHGYRGQPV